MTNNDRSWTVYCHENKVNGKRYFGITSRSVKQRWNYGNGYLGCAYFNRAIQKYGWNSFKHIVLATGLDEDTAKYLEVELIKEYKTQDANFGYNLTSGGDGVPGLKMSERQKELNRKIHSKPICQFDMKMNFIKEYESASEAAREDGFISEVISLCCCHPEGRFTHAGYLWLFKSDVPNVNKEDYLDHLMHRRMSPVIQLTLNMEFIKEFKCAKEAAEFNGIAHGGIRRCVADPYGGPYRNYLWLYKRDYEAMLSGEIPMRQSYVNSQFRPVNQYTKDMGLVTSYKSVKDAAEHFGVCLAAIVNCCKGKNKSSCGFIWKYKDECEEPSQER